MLKKFTLLSAILLYFFTTNIQAQVTVSGSTGANGTYVSLTKAGGAFAAINGASQTGNNIVISITADIANEDGVTSLNSGTWSSITVSPTGARTVSGSVAGQMIKFNGADNVTIDGLNSGGNSLVIENTSSNALATTIRFFADASSNTIQNCTLKGSSTGAALGTIVFSTGTATGNINNVITNNIITASSTTPVNAIYSAGSSVAIANTSEMISNNEISNYFAAASASSGIYIASNSSAWTISGNKFYQSVTRTSTAGTLHHAINIVTASGGNYSISNNIIGYANNAATGTMIYTGSSSRFVAIEMTVSTSSASSVQGNSIAGISLSTSSGLITAPGIFSGVSILAGAVDVGTTSGNTIGGSTGTGSISVTSTTSLGYIAGIYSTSTAAVDIENNNVGSIVTGGTALIGYTFHGINTAGTGVVTISGNVIGSSSTSNSITIGTSGTTTTPICTFNGITQAATGASPTISSNSIRNCSVYGTGASVFRGINNSAGSGTLNIINDTVSTCTLTGTSTFTGITNAAAVATANVTGNVIDSNSPTTTGASTGLSNTGAVTSTVNLNNNTVSNGSLTGSFTGITNTAGNALATVNLNNNLVNNMVLNTAASTFTGITNSVIVTNVSVTGNTVDNNSTINGAFIGITNTVAVTGTITLSNDTVSNHTASGTGAVTGITNTAGNAAATVGLDGNVVKNITLGTGSFTGISHTAGGVTNLSISNNIVRAITTSATAGTFTGIINSGAVTTTININSNSLGDNVAGLVTFNGASSGAFTGISNTAGAATAALTMRANDIRGINHSVNATSAHTYINNSGVTLSQIINSNTFTNLSVATSGNATFISNNVALPAAGTASIDSNSIVTGYNKSLAGGTVTIFNTTTAVLSSNGSTKEEKNNNFSNVTLTGATVMAGWADVEGAAGAAGGAVKTITNNNFSNWTCGSSAVTVLQTNHSANLTAVSSNVISSISGTGAITGISIGNANGGADQYVQSNIISGLTSTAAVTAITGGSASISDSLAITDNTISSLSGSVVNGIQVAAGTKVTVNYDTLSSFTAISSIVGIQVTVTAGGAASNVQGNSFTGVTLNSSLGTAAAPGIFTGIYITAGNVNVGTVAANNIGTTTGTGSVAITSTTSLGLVAGISAASTGTVDIENNTIGAISMTGAGGSPQTIGFSFYGINTSGAAGNMTIVNNVIGSTATASSITVGTNGVTTTGVCAFRGINQAATGTTTITGNTIMNCSANGTAASIFTGIQNAGSTGTLAITTNLLSTSTLSGTGAFTGLTSSSAATTGNITSNTISNNTSTSTGAFAGLASTGALTTANITSNVIDNNAAAGAFTAFSNSGAVTGTLNLNNDTVRNTTLSAANAFIGFSNSAGGAASTANINGNIINDNTITTGAFTGYVTSAAVTSLSINSNIIRGVNTSATAGTFTGISNTGAVTTSVNVTSNKLGDTFADLVAFGAGSTGAFTGITNTGGANASITITGNDFTGIDYNAGGSSANTYILNSSGTTITISNNTFTNLSVNTTGNVIFISNIRTLPVGGTSTVDNNSIITAFNKGGAGGTVTLFTAGAALSPSGTTKSAQNNDFSNITITGATTIAGWSDVEGAAGGGATKTIAYNTFKNWTGGSSPITAIIFNLSGDGTSVSNNNLTNITGTGAITGINIGSSNAGSAESVSSDTISLASSGTGGAVVGITGGSASITTLTMDANVISNLSSTGAAASVVGITSNNGGTVNITNTTLSTISSTGTGAVTVAGIQASVATTRSIAHNTISTLTASAVSATVAGIQLTSGTTINVDSNTVSGLSTTGTTSPVLNGISSSVATASSTVNIFGNVISALSGTGTTAPVATGINISNGVAVNVYKNKLYDISENSSITTANPVVNGILMSGGTAGSTNVTVYNNLIGDLKAPSAAGTLATVDLIRGISVTSAIATTNYNVYNNTVYLNATSSGTNFGTTGMYHTTSATATTATLDLRNNIVANLSTPTGSGKAVAYKRSTAAFNNYASTSNNNLFYAGTAGAAHLIFYEPGTSVSKQTIADYKALTVSTDQASLGNENPPFLSTVGSNSNYLHISTVVSTQIESGGAPVGVVSDDYDGDTRDASTPDVGADEFNGVGNDVNAPAIVYTILGATNSLTDRTLANVLITDNSGVEVTPGTAPRIYYKRSTDNNTFVDNTSLTNGWKYVESTTGSSPFSFTMDYSLLNGGTGVVVGQTIQYFVVAQDVAPTPNVGIQAGTFTATPLSVDLTAAAFPIGGTINSYVIQNSFIGTYTICSGGCNYTSLTAATGAFAAINAGVVTGDVTLTINGNIAVENGATALNEFAAGYKLTIKPNGAARTISGTFAGGLIRLNGADNVLIDGSLSSTSNTICPTSSASRDLTITNNNVSVASAVVWLQTATASIGVTAAANNDTVRNCIITGNSNITTLVGIGSGGTAISVASLGTNNTNNAFINNSVSKTQYGIYSQGASAANKNTGTAIQQNDINTASPSNVQICGIKVGFEDGINIRSNNVAHMSTSGATPAMGISAGYILGNTGTFTGNEVTGAVISRNKIDDILYNGTGSAMGVSLASVATAASTVSRISNNFITGVRTVSAAGTNLVAGIFSGGGAQGSAAIYNNSISLSGVGSNTSPTFGIALGGANPTVDVRNNIVVNKMTTTSGKMYAIGLAYSTYTNLTSNNNDFYTTAVPLAVVGGLANTPAGDNASLTAWQTTTGKDNLSKNVDAAFTSSADLHLDVSSVTNLVNLNGAGAVLGSITTDIDCDSRSSYPDIGADEISVIGYWTGSTSTDYDVVTNWSDQTIPISSSDIVVPTGVTNMPVLSSTSSINNVNLQTATTLSLNGKSYTINGAISGAGTITGSSASKLTIAGAAGTLNFTQTSAAARSLATLTFNSGSSATLGSALDIYDTLKLSTATFNLNSQNLTIKSTATNTGRITNLTGSSLSNSTNVTVERYIPSERRVYRLLAPSVTTTSSVKANWMEGGLNIQYFSGYNVNPNPGYGMHITGASGNTNGFDATPGNSASVFNYNNTSPAWVGIANTSGTLNGKTGYLSFVRGDRSIDLTSTANPLPTSATTLRATGSLLKGTQQYSPKIINDFTLVTNPYASPIDWSLIAADNTSFANYYTYWEPTYGSRGGYITVASDGTKSDDANNATVEIQSGQAFFVRASVLTDSFFIKESHKSTNNNINVFAPTAAKPVFTAKLYYYDATNFRQIADGAKVKYDDTYSKGLDAGDAEQIANFDEDIAWPVGGKRLSIQSRPILSGLDTLFLYMNHMKVRSYQFEFKADNFDPSVTAVLVDNFTGSMTPISIGAQSVVTFTITSAAGSQATNRFFIVFNYAPLPVTFTGIKGYQKDQGIQVEWSVSQEINIDHYEVERSVTGANFVRTGSVEAAGNNNQSAIYKWFDAQPNNGANFYRVKVIDRNGKVAYTQVVKVVIGKGAPAIAVYPNPVTGSTINVELRNMDRGTYSATISNKLGQVLFATSLNHQGGSATETITLPSSLPQGTYQLKVGDYTINIVVR